MRFSRPNASHTQARKSLSLRLLIHKNPFILSCLVAIALCAGPARIASGAPQAQLSLEAGTHAKALGVKGYEISAEASTNSGDGETPGSCGSGGCHYWFCQVVGTSARAGSILLTVIGDTQTLVARHACSGAALEIRVERDGSIVVLRDAGVIAAIIASGGGGAPSLTQTGFEALESDPAWQVFRLAAQDAALQSALEPAPSSVSPNCQAQCDANNPIPTDCSTPARAYLCCVARADLEYCYALCACAQSPSPSLCSIAAAARHAILIAGCAIDELDL